VRQGKRPQIQTRQGKSGESFHNRRGLHADQFWVSLQQATSQGPTCGAHLSPERHLLWDELWYGGVKGKTIRVGGGSNFNGKGRRGGA